MTHRIQQKAMWIGNGHWLGGRDDGFEGLEIPRENLGDIGAGDFDEADHL